MSIRRENQAYKSKLNDETIGTSLIKTVAFIFPVRFEQAISCSSSWMTLFLSICIDPLKMKLKEIENGPDYQPLMWLHTRWSWSSKGQGGVTSISPATKKVLVPGFFLFFPLESDDGLGPDKGLIHWPDLWPAEQFQYPSLHW